MRTRSRNGLWSTRPGGGSTTDAVKDAVGGSTPPCVPCLNPTPVADAARPPGVSLRHPTEPDLHSIAAMRIRSLLAGACVVAPRWPTSRGGAGAVQWANKRPALTHNNRTSNQYLNICLVKVS